jgi:HlyD family secretion protein
MTRELTRAQQQLTHATFASAQLELRASQDGIVKDLSITTIGSVVNPGAVLLTLVPTNEPLRAEVQILNQDIGFVRKGQSVRVKLVPYAFQKYGVLEGTLINISADARDNETNAQPTMPRSSFKALIELQQQFLPTQANDLPISAGMQVTAEIIQGRRTIAEYLLSPVQRIVDESARER